MKQIVSITVAKKRLEHAIQADERVVSIGIARQGNDVVIVVVGQFDSVSPEGIPRRYMGFKVVTKLGSIAVAL